MTKTDEVVKLRRAGKSFDEIKAALGFSSDGSVYYHLHRAKLRTVHLTEAEIVAVRLMLTQQEATPMTEAINDALKAADR